MAKLEDLPIPNHDTLEAVYGELEETRRRFDVLWSKFVDLFGDSPEVIGRSPGRVNLIVSETKASFSFTAKTCHCGLLHTIVVAGVRDRRRDLVARRREYLYLGGLLSSGLSIHQLHSSSLR
ncbi:hypothetical protein JHK85_051499 [Glycine max]|nr:hypothetical protein JHK85_051499 [Glycine max]